MPETTTDRRMWELACAVVKADRAGDAAAADASLLEYTDFASDPEHAVAAIRSAAIESFRHTAEWAEQLEKMCDTTTEFGRGAAMTYGSVAARARFMMDLTSRVPE